MSIVIEDAVKKYGRGESEIYALNHVSFQIESGEVCVILGPSGSGKSTLLNILGLLDNPTSGQYFLLGKEVGDEITVNAPRGRINYEIIDIQFKKKTA